MKNYENIVITIVKPYSDDIITTSGEVTFDEVDKAIWGNAYNTDD